MEYEGIASVARPGKAATTRYLRTIFILDSLRETGTGNPAMQRHLSTGSMILATLMAAHRHSVPADDRRMTTPAPDPVQRNAMTRHQAWLTGTYRPADADAPPLRLR